MELRSAVTKLYSGMFSYRGGWRSTISSYCDFRSYYFSKTSKETKEEARYFFRGLEKCPFSPSFTPNAVVKFATAKVCSAVVCLSTEKETRGSGIIVDSKGTILTCAKIVSPLGVRGQVNVSLLNGRNFSGTVLHIDKKHRFALLKIQSNIPLPIPKFGSLQDNKGSHLIFLQHKFGSLANWSPSSQKEVDEEENLMQSNNKFEYEDCYVVNGINQWNTKTRRVPQ